MKDRELLELAAKAAGIDFTDWPYTNGFNDVWNPLTDDGDALRLAVKLKLQVWTNEDDQWGFKLAESVVVRRGNSGRWLSRVTHEGDPCAATRRAIVLAAAEIGKNNLPDA